MSGKQMRFTFSGKNQDKIDKRWDEFKHLVEKICIKHLTKIHRESPRKLEQILMGKYVKLNSKETNNQQPEQFTKQYIIEPILEFLGYSLQESLFCNLQQ